MMTITTLRSISRFGATSCFDWLWQVKDREGEELLRTDDLGSALATVEDNEGSSVELYDRGEFRDSFAGERIERLYSMRLFGNSVPV